MSTLKKKSNKPTKEILKRSQTLIVKKRVGKFIILSILAILIISGLVYLLYLPALSVRSISIQGNNILDPKDLVAEVNQTLEGKYWYLFPKRSIFIYPKKVITVNLLKQFPRLSGVEIGLGEYDSIVVDVKERDSDSIWCKDYESPRDVLGQIIEIEMASSSEISSPAREQLTDRDCYFSDDSGFIFAPAPYFSSSVFTELSGLLVEEPISSTPLSEESYAISSHFAKNLTKVFTKTENEKYRLIRVKIIDKNNYEAIVVDTTKLTDGEWKIFFDNDESAEELTNNLYTVLNSDPFKKGVMENKGGLASIDLRYGKKVFYKFK